VSALGSAKKKLSGFGVSGKALAAGEELVILPAEKPEASTLPLT
jgi:hypothetical protein